MKKSLNTPYVKTYDEKGLVSNPIVGSYPNQGDNRRTRRAKQTPFIGNGKQYPLTVSGNQKYVRHVQIVPVKIIKGEIKGGNKILHYLAK